MCAKTLRAVSVILLFALLASCAEPTPTPTPKLGIDVPIRIMHMGGAVTIGLCDTPENCPHEPSIPDVTSAEACNYVIDDLAPNAVGYRAALRDMLDEQGIKFTYVGSVQLKEGLAHEGHVKLDRMSNVAYCLKECDWLETAKPDVVLLYTGDWDATFVSDSAKQAEDLTNLINGIYAKVPKSTAVVVAQLTKFATYRIGVSGWANPKRERFNALIPGVVEQLRASGCNVHLVDMWPAVHSDDDLYNPTGATAIGGAYPKPVAYERMARIWFDKIVEIVQAQK